MGYTKKGVVEMCEKVCRRIPFSIRSVDLTLPSIVCIRLHTKPLFFFIDKLALMLAKATDVDPRYCGEVGGAEACRVAPSHRPEPA